MSQYRIKVETWETGVLHTPQYRMLWMWWNFTDTEEIDVYYTHSETITTTHTFYTYEDAVRFLKLTLEGKKVTKDKKPVTTYIPFP